MLSDMFLKLDDVEGESPDSKHSKEIEIKVFHWGVDNASSFGSGTTGGGQGKAVLDDVSFEAFHSKASPKLAEAASTGKHIKSGTFVMRRAGGDQLEWYKMTLTNCILTSYRSGLGASGDQSMDRFSINCEKLKLEVKVQNADGSGGGSVTAEYNFAENKGS
jgi:type VI secretion system secreted protein Hcp